MTYKNKTRLMAVMLMTSPLVAGCTTILDEVQAGIATSAITPKAKKNADGTFVVPNFSAPERTAFSTASPSQALSTFRAMTNPLPKNEKLHLTRVMVSLAHYHACVEHGYKDASYARSGSISKKRPSQCHMANFYLDSHDFAVALLDHGRPDLDQKRVVQQTLGGAPLGDARVVGRTASESWQRWINYSGYKLNGKTRSELMQEFLQGTNGALAWQRF